MCFRIGSALLASTAAVAVVDSCELLLSTAPFGRARSRTFSLALAALVTCGSWAALVVGVGAIASDATSLRPAGLVLEMVAVTLLGWALASSLARRFEGAAVGVGASLAVLGIACSSLLWPRAAELLWPLPADGGAWTAAHVRWTVIGSASAVWLVTTNRDPAARSRSAWRALPARSSSAQTHRS